MRRVITACAVWITYSVATAPSHLAQAAATDAVRPSLSSQNAAPPTTSLWKTFARSADGRPIEMARFGQGSLRVLVIGPLHGDEPTAVAAVDQLADHFARFPERTGDATVTIVRAPNPDGLVGRQAENAHGVDLDRNFPSANWRKVPAGQRWLSGRMPQSEPETRALMALIADVRPERLILVRAGGNGVAVTHGPGAEHLARVVLGNLADGSKVHETLAKSGSLVSYAAEDSAIPTATLSIPHHTAAAALWSNCGPAMLALVNGKAQANTVATAPSGQQSRPPTTTVLPEAVPTPLADNAVPPEGSIDSNDSNHRLAATPVAQKSLAPVDRNQSTATSSRPSQPPRILTVEELSGDVRLVPVVPPRASEQEPKQPWNFGSQAETQAETNRSFLHPGIQRLPPVDRDMESPRPNTVSEQNRPDRNKPDATPSESIRPGWPQAPIPFYPETEDPRRAHESTAVPQPKP